MVSVLVPALLLWFVLSLLYSHDSASFSCTYFAVFIAARDFYCSSCFLLQHVDSRLSIGSSIRTTVSAFCFHCITPRFCLVLALIYCLPTLFLSVFFMILYLVLTSFSLLAFSITDETYIGRN
jgi:hypothetical protein